MRTSKITDTALAEAVAASTSYAGVLRYLGLRQAGGTQTHYNRRVRALGLNTEHFTGSAHNKGKASPKRLTAEQILCQLPDGAYRVKAYLLRRAMLESGLSYKCSCGNIGEWNGEILVLEVDHIDGNWLNNNINNLRFMCPNCHSQEVETNKSHKHAHVA